MHHHPHKLYRKWPLALALLASLAVPNHVLAQNSGDNSIRLEQVKKNIEELRSLLNQIRKERSGIEARLEKTEKEISKVQADLRKAEAELREARNAEKKLQTERGTLKRQLATRKQEIAQSLKAAYVAGQNPRLKLVLNQEKPAKASRMMAYYDHFAVTQADAVASLLETDKKLITLEEQLVRTNQRIEDRRDNLADKEKQLQTSVLSRKQTLAKLNSRESTGSTRLNRLQQEQKELEKLLASIISIADVSEVDRPFRGSRGKLRWPVKGKVIHKYGDRRESTKLTWDGVFIKASAGTAVTAPHHGRVVFSDWMKSFGQLLIIDHGNGYMTLYAHNQELLKTEGDWVLPGEQIARVGDSGGQPQSGLYFEIRHKGRPSNPMVWLVASR